MTENEKKIKIKSDFEDFMRLLDFEEEAVISLLEDFDRIWNSENGRAKLLNRVETYRDTGVIDFGKTCEDAIVTSRENNMRQNSSTMVFYMCTAMYSYPRFVEKGLDRRVWIDSMSDFRCKLHECKKRYDEWGTFVNWFARWYTVELVAFGRLAFEINPALSDFKNDEFDIKEGQPIIDVHILSNERVPFTKEVCDESYRRAAEFFAPQFKDTPIIFRCYSWLLYEGHKEMLPPDSNILRFASEFTISETHDSLEDLWRIFYIREYNNDPENLSDDTALKRGYKKLLSEGKVPQVASGYKYAK